MSRRVVAPCLLLLAAVLSAAAVFAVHRIEAGGGPIAEPSVVPPHFSPNGDGEQDLARINFTTADRERISVRILDSEGAVVRELLDHRQVDGSREVPWDGRRDDGELAKQGEYRAEIARAGDPRTYEPTDRIVLDLEPPVGRLDQLRSDGMRLTGLALLEPKARLVAIAPDGTELESRRQFLPDPDSFSAKARGPRPKGTVSVRFIFRLGDLSIAGVRFLAYDLAGNRTPLSVVRLGKARTEYVNSGEPVVGE